MKKLVIIDFDGTIADSSSYAYDIYVDLMTRLSRPVLDQEQFELMRKKPLKERIKQAGIPLYKIGRLVKLTKTLQKQYVLKTTLFPGIRNLLMMLKDHYELAIVSSNTVSNIKRFLTAHDLDIFASIIGNQGIHGKAKALKKTLKAFNLAKDHALYVGDETRDIRAAKKARLPIVSVAWGFDHRELLEAHNPGRVATSNQDLKRMIDDLLKA
jgi:phosphoglycolate phosphatase